MPAAAGAAQRADRLRLREHRVRRPRDHARRPARAGDPEAAPRDAAAGRDLHRGDARLDADRVRAPDRRALRARPRRSTARRFRPRSARSSSRSIIGAVVLRRARRRDGVAHPLGGGLVRGRELHPPADGVPHGLVRPDAPLPGVPARDRRRAAAEVLHRPGQRDLSQRACDLDEAARARRARRLGRSAAWSLRCSSSGGSPARVRFRIPR